MSAAGTVERVVIAGNAPLSTFKTDGPPTPDDGLSVDVETSSTSLRPIPGLPPIDDADLTVRVTGGTATIHLGRGVVNVAPGRSLNIADGVLSVPDTHPKLAPAQADFRIDGSVPAAAMLLANKLLSRNVGIKLDPATSRGTVAANVTLKLPLARSLPKNSVRYAVSAVLSSFGADKTLMGEKLEAASLHVTAASGGGYQIKGNAKINGLPAAHRRRQEARRRGCGPATDGQAGRGRTPQARHRFRRCRQRHRAGQAHRQARRRRQGQQVRSRRRSHARQDRRPVARLGQDARRAGASHRAR